MEWLVSVINGKNAIPIIIIVVLLVVIIAILAKKGIFSFNAFGLKIDNGDDERDMERAIIRSQMMFIRTEISDFYNKIPDWDGRDDYRLRYIMEKAQDVFYEAISINHITLEPVYVEIKQKAVWAEVLQNAESDNILNDDFKNAVYDETKRVLSKLIDIRDYYKKEKK